MKKICIALFALAAMTAMVSCRKEAIKDLNNTLFVEDVTYAGDTKAYIANRYACWENGDQIRLQMIGGSAYDGMISISSPNGTPVVTANAGDGFNHEHGEFDVYGAYPKALFEGLELGTSTSFTYPSSYNYTTTNGKQKITCPMIAKVTKHDDKDYLSFVSLCTILKVVVPAPSVGAFIANSITVTSANGSNLSGDATVNFETQQVNTSGLESNGVSLMFTSGNVAINEPQTFYVPIPPVTAGTKLTIKINNALNNKKAISTIYAISDVPVNMQATINYAVDSMNSAAYARYQFYDYISNTSDGSHTLSGFVPIDLGVSPDNRSKLEMTFVPVITNTSQYYTGADYPAVFGLTGPMSGVHKGYFAFIFGDKAVNSSPMKRVAGNKYRHSFEVKADPSNPGYYYADCVFTNVTTNETYTRQTESILNGLVSAPHVYAFGYDEGHKNPGMKMYSYKIWINGSLAHNFVPAIDTENGNAVGVYDMASTSATTSFITLSSGFVVGND